MSCPRGRGCTCSCRPCLELQELLADAVGFSWLVACPLPRLGLLSTVVAAPVAAVLSLVLLRGAPCVVQGYQVSEGYLLMIL